jgi:molybdate transport system substrate-binding protein
VVRALLLILVATAVAAGCGDSDAPAQAAPRVYAASSLRTAFPEIDSAPTYNFAGSNTLQTQIENGAPADAFASASPDEAQALFRADRCTRPVTFATNVVVVLVPRDNPAGIDSVGDLARGARKRLAIGSEGVPVGDYTRELLERMGLSSILERNTVSSETNVGNITSKVALGSADAGFAYMTDATVAGDRVRTIRIPSRAQPSIRYQLCAVRRPGADTEGAQAFIRRVTSDAGREVLRKSGFGLPPRASR